MSPLDNPLYEEYSTYENPMHFCGGCLLIQIETPATWKRIAHLGTGETTYVCDEHKIMECQ